MNTEVTFYCTHQQYGSFYKTIYKVVIGDSVNSLNDVKNWLDNNVNKLYIQHELDLVFDWIVIDYKQTKKPIAESKEIKTVIGYLSFDNTTHSTKTKKTPKPKYIEIDKVREYQSVWIDPFGEQYVVGFACHNEFASKWLKENDIVSYKRVNESLNLYHYEMLEEKGWARVLGWTDPPSFVLPENITPKLKTSLRDYCVENDVKYEAFPEILKN